MKFSNAAQVTAVISNMTNADRTSSANRAKIANLFNGDPPYTETERKRLNIPFSINFMEATKIAMHARGVLNGAFVDVANPITIKVATGDTEKDVAWGNWATDYVNNLVSCEHEHLESQREKFGQMVVLGVGPTVWCNKKEWSPKSIPIFDIRIPRKTKRSMANLEMFAVRTSMSAADIAEATSGEAVDKGWDTKAVSKLVKDTLVNTPEAVGQFSSLSIQDCTWDKLAHEIREMSGFFSSDVIPTLDGWDFYFKKDDGKWARRMVMDLLPTSFVFEDDDYADDWRHIIHFQIGDCNSVAPFTYHTIRGLGFMLYGIIEITNRLRCEVLGATFLDQKTLFKNVGDGDRERIQKVELQNLGVIPEGLSVVPSNERYGTNVQLANGTLNGLRQLASEHSQAFTPDLQNSPREMTAQEVLARTQSSSALTNAVLSQAFTHEAHSDKEICRRIFKTEEFRSLAKKNGIPLEAFDGKYVKITRNRSPGSGSRENQMRMAQALFQVYQYLDPQAQRMILRMYVEAFSDVPGTGFKIVPEVQDTNTPSREKACYAWGSLMDGAEVITSGALNIKEYLDMMVKLLTAKVQYLQGTQQKNGEAPEEDTLQGLSMVVEHINQKLEIMSQDPSASEIVKVFGDVSARVGKIILDWAKMGEQEAEESTTGLTKAEQEIAMLQARIQAITTMAETQSRIKESAAAQKRQHADIKLINTIGQKEQMTHANIALKDVEKAADITRKNMESIGEPAK